MTSDAWKGFFGSRIECECGKTHQIEPKEVYCGDDAIGSLPEIAGRVTADRLTTVIMDSRTRNVAGADCSAALEETGWKVQRVIVPDPPDGDVPICDDKTLAALTEQVPRSSLLVSVGSGVITDLTKWLASERNLPFVGFATAGSMNGYTSANVAPTIAGVKSLIWAKPAAAILASSKIIAGAPWELTSAGLGDVLAKSVSTADWRLNNLIFGDYYCPRSANLIAKIEPLYMDQPEELYARKPAAIEALFSALLLTGAAMTMAGTSSPASGGEHMISHSLDMLSSIDGKKHDLHGRQVGVGTVLMSEVYRRVLELESPAFADPGAATDSAFWGRFGGIVAKEHSGKAQRLRIASKKLAKGHLWDRVREELAPMTRKPEAIRNCLAKARAAHKSEQIGCDKGRLLGVLLHAHEIRSRLTVIDLARIAGVLPAAANEIIEAWA